MEAILGGDGVRIEIGSWRGHFQVLICIALHFLAQCFRVYVMCYLFCMSIFVEVMVLAPCTLFSVFYV